jgi:hypothetical protein
MRDKYSLLNINDMKIWQDIGRVLIHLGGVGRQISLTLIFLLKVIKINK